MNSSWLKKTGFIMLIFLLLVQSGGMMLYYLIHQGMIKIEMAERLKKENALSVKLVLTQHQYSQSRVNSREICVEGEMYDVKTVKHTGTKVEIEAIHDEAEGGLISLIRSLAHHHSGNKSIPDQLTQLLSLTYLPSFTEETFSIPFSRVEFCSSFSSRLNPVFTEIPSPPPWLG